MDSQIHRQVPALIYNEYTSALSIILHHFFSFFFFVVLVFDFHRCFDFCVSGDNPLQHFRILLDDVGAVVLPCCFS